MPEKHFNIFLQKRFTIADLIFESLKKWYIIVLAVFIAFVSTYVYTMNFVTPLYTSSAKIFILSKQSSEYYTTTDFTISTYISNDFAEIIQDTPIMKLAAKDLKGKYSVGYLKNAVRIEKRKETRIIEVKATTPNPEDSKKIVDSICKNAKERIVEIMKLDSVEIIKEGEIPTNPSSPNLTNNIFFAVLIAFLIAEFVIILNYSLNNKIASCADVENFLELSVLATIPFNQSKKTK